MKTQYKNPVFANPDFLQAIQNSDFEAVKDWVINREADVNACSYSMTPVLACAIYSQNAQIIDFFLEQGALINPDLDVAITPLGAACRVAAMADNTENINYTFGKLIDLGADLNPANCRSTPLTEVIRTNGPCSEIMARYLVKLGAEINPTIDYTLTPLTAATQIAVSTGETDLFFKCLEFGANINPTNNTQTSPLIAAIQSGGPVAKIIASYLIQHGAELRSTVTDNDPLYQAAMQGNKDIFELITEKDADINKNFASEANLYEATILSGNLEMLQYLMSKGMKLCWNKVLEISVYNNQPSGVEMTKFLIKEANKHEQTYDKKGLLAKAISSNNIIITDLLLEEDGELDLSDHQGCFNFSTPWTREKAIKLNHPLSELLKVVNGNNIDEIFQITTDLIKGTEINKQNTDQILQLIIGEKGPELLQKILKDMSKNPSDATKALTLCQLKYTFKYGDKFVLATQTGGKADDTSLIIAQNGGDRDISEIKEQSKTCIIEHKVCLVANNNTPLDDSNINNHRAEGTHYVVSKKGDLFVNPKGYQMCHAYFLKGKEGKTMLGDIPMHGYGKPVACGGHIKFKDGLITKITNGSGHYTPNSDQLKLVCKYFKELSVLSDNVVIEAYDYSFGGCVKVNSSEFLDSIVVGDILAQYPELG